MPVCKTLLNFIALLSLGLILTGCVHPKQPLNRRLLTPVEPPFGETGQKQEVVVHNGALLGNRFVFGEKSFDFSSDGKMFLNNMRSPVKYELTYAVMTEFSEWMELSKFRDLQIKSSPAKGMITITAKFPVDKPGRITGEVKIEAKLLPDGLIRFDVDRKVPEDAKKMLKAGHLLIYAPDMDVFPGMSFDVDGKKYPVSRHDDYTYLYKPNKFKNASLDMGAKVKSFAINGLYPGELAVSVNMGHHMAFWIRSAADGQASFTLDLREGIKQTAYAGIDIKATDDLNTPTWRAGSNLVQNASFEAGFRYWKFQSKWGDPKDEKLFEIDNSVAKFGKSSLLLRPARSGCGGILMSFTFPLNKGKKYTGSCWAKSDGVDHPALSAAINTWIPQSCSDKKSLSTHDFIFNNLNTEWKRYSFSFIPEGEGNNAASFTIRGIDGAQGAKAWVDGVQFEEGELSNFQPAPCAELLVNGQPAANLDSQSPLDSELILRAAPKNINGTVNLTVENFQKITQFKGSFGFRTDAQGEAQIKLPWATKDFLKGINIVRAEFTGKNLEYTDYFRFNIMDYLKGTQKNKDMCGVHFSNYVSAPNKNIYLNNLQYFGIGALDGSDSSGRPSKADMELLKSYGISQECSLFGSRPAGYLFFTNGVAYQKVHISDGSKELVAWDGSITNVRPEFEKQIEKATETVARNKPWINSWALWGEFDGQLRDMPFDELAKLLSATYRGAKKGNPHARVYLEQGCQNMAPMGGISFLRGMLQAVGQTPKFDAVAIHTYRAAPERPDLDDNAVALLEMLQKNGYGDTDVYWNEGFYYAAYNIPAWELSPNPYINCEHWTLPPPSYDMGWGEKISAAYIMRSYLVALKYQNRIKSANCWSLNDMRFCYMDVYNTPLALIRTINTLGNLLGNAEFKEDIRFARNSRAYVFETPEKQPVVAVWSYIPGVDRGGAPEPVFEVNLADCNVEYFDMMGAQREVPRNKDGADCVPLSPFPVFIKGARGSLPTICRALKNATVKGEALGSPFKVRALLSDTNTITLNFQNMFSKAWHGALNIDGEISVLSVPSLATDKRQLRLKQAVTADHITEIKLPVSLQEDKGPVFCEDITLPAFHVKKARAPIKIDGDLSDWEGVPAINVTNRIVIKGNAKVGYPGDHAAWFKVAWDETHLYLCSKVVDDNFSVNAKLDISTAQWQNDCMQVYFDTFCDARANYSISSGYITGLDKNDYNFDFFPDLHGEKLVAYRRWMPEPQLCGGTLALQEKAIEPGIKTAFQRTADGYIYEVAFPKSYIEPINLAPGANIGFGIMWSDRDEESLKSHLSIIPGKGCQANVHLWPIMILTNAEK